MQVTRRIDTPREAIMTPVLDPGLAAVLNDAPAGRLEFEVDGFVRNGDEEPRTVALRGHLEKPNVPFGTEGQVGALVGSLGGLPVSIAFHVSGLSLLQQGTIGDDRVDLTSRANLLGRKYETSGTVGAVRTSFDLRRSGRNASVSGSVGAERLQAQAAANPEGTQWRLSGGLGADRLEGTLTRVSPEEYLLTERVGPVQIEERIRIRRV